ncbi:MAG: dephospho-CoA kinase, partial [Spirochaetota bacterium]|nr:dephospho-CoA kinase [Spirochaetota bacterium]
MAGTIIGITGKCCTGKNEAAEYLHRIGWHVIDVDRTGHQALGLEKARIVERFGPGVVAPDGSVDRQVLGRIVFHNQKELRALESIVHPRMREMVESEAEEARRNG